VLRDARGNIKANTATNIIISILQGSATGTTVYSETHNATTDSYGLINLEIGKGTATIGALSAIDWGTGTYYVKVTVDGVEMGTGQLLSVPYAFYASKAANGFSGSYTDLTNKPTLFDGTWLNLTGKPSLSTVATSGSYNDLTNKPTITNGTVTSITGTAPVSVATGTTTPVISMVQANGTTNGYLSSIDWTTFNNKSSFSGTWADLSGKPIFASVATSGSYSDLTNTPTITTGTVTAVTGTAPLSVVTGTTTPVISLPQASGTTNGYLSSTDWTTFNNKSSFNGTWAGLSGKPAFANVATSGSYGDLSNTPTITTGTVTAVTGTAPLSVVTGTTTPVISMPQASGTTNGYLSSANWLTFNNKSSFSGSYTDLTNTPTTDGSETIVYSGTNVTVTGTGTSGNPYVINATAHTLGEEYGGGIVFFVYDGGQHGLIAAKEDLLGGYYGDDPYFVWFGLYCPEGCTFIESGAKGDGLGSGAMNTTLIVASQVTYTLKYFGYVLPYFAAKACADYEVTITTTDGDITIGDWYLPSKYELNLLYLSQVNIATLNLSSVDPYWSSTENDLQYSWYQDFSDGYQDYYLKSDAYLVRPIRAF
jgi:ribosomal protein S8E